MQRRRTFFRLFSFLFLALFLTACGREQSVVNNVSEREANEIVVYLTSKGIKAYKVQASATGAAAAGGTSDMWNIMVDADHSTDAMALLNRMGLPRPKGTTLLSLFAKSGLMSSDKEETIRYQAGLMEELKGTILKIDGVIDAEVQISFPSAEAAAAATAPGATKAKMKAAVYVKHQGVMDDPNNHLETKIKRLLSGAVDGLDFDNVSVISDRARLADIMLQPHGELISSTPGQQEYVSIWSIIMTRGSLAKFRVIFFTLIVLILIFAGGCGYLAWRFYPQFFQKIIPKKLKKGKKEEEAEEEEITPGEGAGGGGVPTPPAE